MINKLYLIPPLHAGESFFMNIRESHIVPPQEGPSRLQEYAVGIFHTITTRSAVKKAIKKELILVNGNIGVTGTYINGGEEISLLESPPKHKAFHLQLEVLFEDDYLAIINKPAGIAVSGNSFATIDNALAQNLEPSQQEDAVRPRPVHRLDYPTSGLLLIGKTSSSIQRLSQLFEKKEIQKTYHAITIGKMNPEGTISTPIDNKEALTQYWLLSFQSSQRFVRLNLLKLSPKTGRRHQLRKHLASLGNPILGDKEYGTQGLILHGKGLYLHASRLEFIHPFTEEIMNIKCELTKKFAKIFPL
jgi:23S rRNA pseudouridine1911/1915/1917 synthase